MKWIQKAMSHMKKGAFTSQSARHHKTTKQFANEVLKHPSHYKMKTRRRAQFLKNIRSTIKVSRKK